LDPPARRAVRAGHRGRRHRAALPPLAAGAAGRAVIAFRPRLPIRTERLILRTYRKDDYDDFAAFQSRDDVHTWLYTVARSPEEIWEALDQRTTRDVFEEEGDGVTLAIELLDGGTVVGDVSLWVTSEQHAQGEIGFLLHPDHQGNGYAREAAVEALRL